MWLAAGIRKGLALPWIEALATGHNRSDRQLVFDVKRKFYIHGRASAWFFYRECLFHEPDAVMQRVIPWGRYVPDKRAVLDVKSEVKLPAIGQAAHGVNEFTPYISIPTHINHPFPTSHIQVRAWIIGHILTVETLRCLPHYITIQITSGRVLTCRHRYLTKQREPALDYRRTFLANS